MSCSSTSTSATRTASTPSRASSAAVPRAKVLILTALKDRARDQAAVRTGARGLVLKDAPADALLEAIRAVAAGELWFDPRVLPAPGQAGRRARAIGALEAHRA